MSNFEVKHNMRNLEFPRLEAGITALKTGIPALANSIFAAPFKHASVESLLWHRIRQRAISRERLGGRGGGLGRQI